MNTYYNIIKNKTTILPKNLLEIGSRDGEDAKQLSIMFGLKDKNVWIVEPNPKQYLVIKNNFPYFNIIDSAIYNISTQHTFYQKEGDMVEIGTCSLLNRNDNWYNNANVITVNTITGKELLDITSYPIDLCKIDVEGVAYEVLESFGEKIILLKSIYVECEHREIWKNQKLFGDVKKLLTNFNYIEIYRDNIDNIQSNSIWVLKEFINEN